MHTVPLLPVGISSVPGTDVTLVALVDLVSKEGLTLIRGHHPLLIPQEVLFRWRNEVKDLLSLKYKSSSNTLNTYMWSAYCVSCLSGLDDICLGCLSFFPTSHIASVLCTCISIYMYIPCTLYMSICLGCVPTF